MNLVDESKAIYVINHQTKRTSHKSRILERSYTTCMLSCTSRFTFMFIDYVLRFLLWQFMGLVTIYEAITQIARGSEEGNVHCVSKIVHSKSKFVFQVSIPIPQLSSSNVVMWHLCLNNIKRLQKIHCASRVVQYASKVVDIAM